MSNHAAVGHNDLTGDIACRVRSQERDNARNLLRLAEAAERNLFDRAFLNGIRQHLRHIRVNEAGRNRVYAQGVLRSVTSRTVEIRDEDARMMCLHQLGRTGGGTVGRASLDQAAQWTERPFGTAFVVFSQGEYERLLRDIPACASLPVVVAAQKWLNPATCVVFAPNEKFDFSYFKRVVAAGRPLSESYLPYIAESGCECLSLYGESAEPPVITDRKVRAAFVAFDMMARRGERAATPQALANAVRAQSGLSAEEYELSRLILENLGLISVSDRGIITVSRQKTELSRSAYYVNARHEA